jgi:hypothetical protein
MGSFLLSVAAITPGNALAPQIPAEYKRQSIPELDKLQSRTTWLQKS